MEITSPEILEKNKNNLSLIKLDLASGQSPREGYEGVDAFAPNAKYQVDLLKFPWPWADSSVDAIHCSHFIEHIPMEERNGKDMLFCFFDECYRILKPNAEMTVICPSARSNRAFQDPTHRRFIVAETFLYFDAEWRKQNKLDHYNVSCNFTAKISPMLTADTQKEDPVVLKRLINHYWNIVHDWRADLKTIK